MSICHSVEKKNKRKNKKLRFSDWLVSLKRREDHERPTSGPSGRWERSVSALARSRRQRTACWPGHRSVAAEVRRRSAGKKARACRASSGAWPEDQRPRPSGSVRASRPRLTSCRGTRPCLCWSGGPWGPGGAGSGPGTRWTRTWTCEQRTPKELP